MVLVASPSLSILLAHALGVGRGVDLVIYLSLPCLAFLLLLVFSKIRDLEAQITALAGEAALWRARG